MRLLLSICVILLLCGCSASTGSHAVTKVPVRTCSVPGFSCHVIRNSDRDVGLSMTNNIGSDMNTATMSLDTKDCTLISKTVSIGRVPINAGFPVHFTCNSTVPAKLSGELTLNYTTKLGKQQKSIEGSINLKN